MKKGVLDVALSNNSNKLQVFKFGFSQYEQGRQTDSFGYRNTPRNKVGIPAQRFDSFHSSRVERILCISVVRNETLEAQVFVIPPMAINTPVPLESVT